MVIKEKKVLLDTNFLLIPTRFKVDIFEEIKRICQFKYEIFVLDKTLLELQKIIVEQRGQDKLSAKIALELLKAKNINIITTESDKSVDDLIVEMSKEREFIVATQDTILRKRLKEKDVSLIILKKKQYLELYGV